jgi:hypothetical protein
MVAVIENLRSAEVMRILERYLIEVVERYELCPWANQARQNGELAVEILWSAPDLQTWQAAAVRLLDQPRTRVAMVITPKLEISRTELGRVRDQLGVQLPGAGVAEFHPIAALDLTSPGRLVPFVRRSPDPMLQLIPLAILDAYRAGPLPPGRAAQAQMLGGHRAPSRPDVSERIAAANHATVTAHGAAIASILDDIAADRERSYRRVGIVS